VTWVHWSPNEIPVGDYVVPMASREGLPTSFGEAWENAARLGQYAPNRAYVMALGHLQPTEMFGRLAFCRPEHFCYEVEPEDLGPDTDLGQRAMNSASCARAKVIRWLYVPSSRRSV
jgi:hypothetical protein